MSNAEWQNTFDIVVLGAGAAGMTAALVAATEGLRVLLVESTDRVGGSSAYSAGTLWIPGNFTMDEAQARADISAAQKYLDTLIGERSSATLRNRFLQHGPLMLRYLKHHSCVRFRACPKHTDYYPDLPGASPGGRPVEALVYDGRKLGSHFKLLRPPLPELTVFGGMMVSKADVDILLNVGASAANMKHALGLVLRYAMDRLRYPRGTRLTMGNALCAGLLRSVLDAGATLRLCCRVTDIRKDSEPESDARHIVRLSTPEGPWVVRSTRAVVFAGGGYSGNRDWRKRYMPKPVPEYTTANESNNATTQMLALRLGAVLGTPNEHNAWWFPSSIVPRNDGPAGLFPHIVMDRAKPGLIAVGADGRRFVNEGVNYHEFSVAQYRHNAVPCWLVCDADFIRRYGLGAVRPGGRAIARWVRDGYLTQAGSLQELATSIGVDADGLQVSAQRMTQFAVTGVDLEFGKGDDRLSKQNGDPMRRPNPCLGPIRKAPFYAVKVAPADLGTSLGLSTNENAQLLDAQEQPIAGLYACGNDMNSIMGGQYPAPGTTIGPGMTFAYLAASHAAGLTDL